MKKLLLSVLGLMAFINVNAQYPTVWPLTTTSNGTNAGYVGLGIKPLSTSTTLPGFNFQVHGIADYILTTPGSPGPEGGGTPGNTLNFGKTARIGLTNTTTGASETDGTVFRQNGLDFTLMNQEFGRLNLYTNGFMQLSGGGTSLFMQNSRSYFGTTTSYFGGTDASLNIQSTSDNGLYLRTQIAGKYGLSVKVASDIEKAIIVYGTDATKVNFEVRGNGNVFARKYTTTLASPFPDYVFAKDYNLLSFSDLRSYLATNNRLPNMPSATQVDTEGADLGELNILLVEKVEELTLYILQLEERMQKVENVK